MDPEKLIELIEYPYDNDSSHVDSLMIIRNGYLITEVYFYPFTKGSKHDIASITRSFISTLIGITIDKGYISDVEKRVLNFFPDRNMNNLDTNKKAMRLKHLLTMETGFERIAEPAEVTLVGMVNSSDWVAGDSEFEWLVGLDGVQRISPGRYDLPAAGKGKRYAVDSFVVEIDEIRNNKIRQFGLSFKSNRVVVILEESSDLYPEIKIRGEIVDNPKPCSVSNKMALK